LDKPAEPDPAFDAMRPDPAASTAPYRIFNIGNNRPTPLMDYIVALEQALGFEARKNFLPMQPGDVPATFADVDALNDWVGFRAETPVAEGVRHFVQWYRAYYRV
jgi:UDP-glucuronate 4-epimerase